MKLFQLHSKQCIPITKKEAWDFLSSPANLKVITPDHMGFNILAGADRPMFPGQIIQYKVSPFPGFPGEGVDMVPVFQQLNKVLITPMRAGLRGAVRNPENVHC